MGSAIRLSVTNNRVPRRRIQTFEQRIASNTTAITRFPASSSCSSLVYWRRLVTRCELNRIDVYIRGMFLSPLYFSFLADFPVLLVPLCVLLRVRCENRHHHRLPQWPPAAPHLTSPITPTEPQRRGGRSLLRNPEQTLLHQIVSYSNSIVSSQYLVLTTSSFVTSIVN
ncbi:hypothetical protein DFH06DRAFT_625155 [Mycena polygramma]|nr:hypothetical protein DFH06DRAFT_625155 [Mycena polygramma]